MNDFKPFTTEVSCLEIPDRPSSAIESGGSFQANSNESSATPLAGSASTLQKDPIMKTRKTRKTRRTTVNLPNLIPHVDLPPNLAVVLEKIIWERGNGASSFQLSAEGVCNPSAKVSKLKQLGAIIETRLAWAPDLNGTLHRGIAHYVYHGWAA